MKILIYIIKGYYCIYIPKFLLVLVKIDCTYYTSNTNLTISKSKRSGFSKKILISKRYSNNQINVLFS